MSIASEITRIQDNISDAYTAANAKGATMPATQNSDNLATTIATIPTGTTPTGSTTITNNGTYDVTDKATAVVNVPTTAPALYREFEISSSGLLQPNKTTTHMMNFAGVKDILDYMLYRLYFQNTAITGTVDFSSLTTLSGQYAMQNAFFSCTGLTTVSFPALTTLSGYYAMNGIFQNCTGLTSLSFQALTGISGEGAMSSAFNGCTGLTTVSLPALTIISERSAMARAFQNCTGLTTALFTELTTISGRQAMEYTFVGCANLTTVSFPALSTITGQQAFDYTFNGCTGLTSVSFPALSTITGRQAMNYTFSGCTGLTSVSFPALKSNSFGSSYKNQIAGLIPGVTGCTIHFPSNLDPQTGSTVISGLVGYPNFGGTNTVLAFDLPATE